MRILPVVFLAACANTAAPSTTFKDVGPDVTFDTAAPSCAGLLCDQQGLCTPAGGLCIADSTSCVESHFCKKYGHCTAVQYGKSVTCERSTDLCKNIDGDTIACGDDNPCTFDFCGEDGCRYGWSLTPTTCGKNGTCKQGTCK